MKTNGRKNSKNKTIIPVFFACDDNYAPLLHVAIESIKAHASGNNEYRIYVLYDNLNEQNRKLLGVFNSDNMKIECVNMKEVIAAKLDLLFTRDYYSHATYFRVFIPALYPQYSKALYLDCDIALNADVAELYNFDIGDNYVGAVTCEACDTVPVYTSYVENYIGNKLPLYFNAGILLINLDMWRKVDIVNAFFDLMSQIKFEVIQDQDYLNVLCRGRVKFLPKVWNKWSRPDSLVPEADVKLVHYNLTYRPWKYDNIKYGDIFWKHAKNTVMHQKILEMKANFTKEDAANDEKWSKNLQRIAREHAEKTDDSFRILLANDKVVLWKKK